MATPLSNQRPASGFAVGCLGLQWQTESSLKALLTVIHDRQAPAWHHVDDISAADLVLYDPTSPLASALLRRASGQESNRLFVPCSHQLSESDGGLHLPIGASRLRELLDQIATRLGDKSPVAPHECLSQRLDELLQNPDLLGVAFAVGGETGFLSLSQRAMYWPQPLDAAGLARLLLDQVVLQPIRATDRDWAARLEAVAPKMRSWDAMLWAVGASTGSGRLLSRLHPGRRYQLSRWPDFGLIGRRSVDIKCTALLSQRALTPDELASLTGLPQSSVANFLNCAALCGILQDIRLPGEAMPAVQQARPADSVMGGVLRRLRQAFSLGMA